MFCDYECYVIGGPWIAENPNCPIHGNRLISRIDRWRDILEQVKVGDVSVDDALTLLEEEL